jgi:uncharacterized OsmC-like protein
MKPLPHHYDVHLSGGPSGYAQLSTVFRAPRVSSGSVREPRTAPPVEYDGPLASVQACFLFTLRAIARLSKVGFLALELDASGTVDRHEGATRFTEIVLRPRLTVRSGTDRERALHVLEKSEKACLVSASPFDTHPPGTGHHRTRMTRLWPPTADV